MSAVTTAISKAKGIICEACERVPSAWEVVCQPLVDIMGLEADPSPFRVCGDCLPQTVDLTVLIAAELEEL